MSQVCKGCQKFTLVSPPAEEEVLSRPVKTQLDLAAVARVASVAEKDAMLWLFKLHLEGKEPPEDKAILSCIVLSFLLLPVALFFGCYLQNRF